MISFPNCKINLGLNIVARRTDGFHALETIFFPVAIKDVLEIIPQQEATTDVDFTVTGLPVNGDTSDNLCIKAYRLLRQDFPGLPPVTMHLHKAIPMGAGLGGGSADGAFTLTMLDRKFNLGLSHAQLTGYALQLGSDCPFFIHNRPSFATGRGEQLEAVDVDLSAYRLFIVNPGIHVNTGWAFSQVTPKAPATSLKEIITLPVKEWKDRLVNDFEEPVFNKWPEIGAIKENLYAQGAVYAAMSGSGSSLFGIFEKQQNLSPLSAQYSNYLTKVV